MRTRRHVSHGFVENKADELCIQSSLRCHQESIYYRIYHYYITEDNQMYPTIGVTVVSMGDTSEALLSSSVPYLQENTSGPDHSHRLLV